MFCGIALKEDAEGQEQRVWCSKSASCSLNPLPTSNVEGPANDILPSKQPKRQKLTADQRAMIIEKHRQDSKLSQKKLAEWAASQFGVEGLSQNTVSRILSSAAENRQSGKLTHAQQKLICEEYEKRPA